MNRIARLGCLIVFAFAIASAEAGLFQDIFRGLDYAATPLGSPVTLTGDGTRVNGARSGRVRIVPNGIGQGYQLEYDRTFGVDTRGRPETLRLAGFGELTLNGGVQATLGFNGLRDSAYKLGHGDLTVNNLQYNLRTTVGGEDVQLAGTLNVANALEINTFGFYNMVINVSNANSVVRIDGVLANDTRDTNFDIGPIVVKGNIFYDGLLALATGLGADTTALEGLFPNSAIGEINEAIRAQIQAAAGAQAVAGERVTAADVDRAPLLLAAVFDQNTDAARTLMESVAASAVVSQEADDSAAIIPEPGTLLLMAAGATALWAGRRRH